MGGAPWQVDWFLPNPHICVGPTSVPPLCPKCLVLCSVLVITRPLTPYYDTIYREGNEGSERLGNLPKVTQLSGEGRSLVPGSPEPCAKALRWAPSGCTKASRLGP